MRALAFVEGFGLAYRRRGRNPVPAAHAADTETDIPAAGKPAGELHLEARLDALRAGLPLQTEAQRAASAVPLPP